MEGKEEVFVTNSFEETQKLGREFVKNISGQGRALSQERTGAVTVALHGELGSGKTTFVQGMAKGFGIKRRIISPTFIIVRSYELESQKSKVKSQKYNSKFKSFEQRTFYHIDLYRMKSDRDIQGLGLEEIINNPENIVAIEWAEKVKNLLPRNRWDIKFDYLSEDKRRIAIEKLEARNPKSETIPKSK